MALIGNCSHTTYTAHATNTVNETRTLSDGTEETVTVPETVVETTDYTNIYLCIKQLDHYNFYDVDDEGNAVKFAVIHYRYAGYVNKAARDADQEDFLFTDVGNLNDYNYDGNLYTQIYNEIKTLDGKTNLTDD